VTSSSSSTPAAPPPWRSARGPGISQRVLVACPSFGPRLSAEAVTGALARGLTEGGVPATDLCPLPGLSEHGDDVRALLDELDFDARMRAARAVVLGAWRLEEGALAGSATFEIATRARQNGVPAYAVAGESALDAFDARILDLQAIVRSRSRTGLHSAGRTLAVLV
jgi:glycerate kinase